MGAEIWGVRSLRVRINRPFGRAYVPFEHDSLGSCKFVRFAYAILETLSCPSSTAHSASFGCASASPYSRPTGTSRSAEVRRAAVRLIAWKSLIWCFFERALAMGRWSKIRRNPFLRTPFRARARNCARSFSTPNGHFDAGCEKPIPRYVCGSGLWRG